MRRRRPMKHDGELGLTLYGPTPANPKFRLDYTDPFTGERRQPRRIDKAEAEALFEETLVYLQTARRAVGVGGGAANGAPRPKNSGSAPTVDDLFDARMQRWQDDGCSVRYIATRQGRYDYRIRPVFGSLTVREWAQSSEGCREVLRAARVQGLAPKSVQDLGALMRGLVSLGWEKRWIPPAHNPMLGVKYTAGATVQGQGPEYVRPEDRPAFAAVEKLVLAYEELAEETGIFWLPERTLVGAHGGLRPGERDALRLCDLRSTDLEIAVEWSFEWARGDAVQPLRKRPKNGKTRRVLVPASDMERLVALCERRRAAGAADDALLFEDPRRPGLPLSEATTRRLHIEAGLKAGWETVEVRRRAGAKRHLGPDLRPRHSNYSLRHHAASWMHDVAGFDWADVSRALGHHSVAFTYAVYVRSGADADERNRARLLQM